MTPQPLAQRDPVAFRMLIDLTGDPRRTVTVHDVIDLTGVTEATAAAALDSLVETGHLAPASPDAFAFTTALDEPLRACGWCQTALTGRQRLFCSKTCADHSRNALVSARNTDRRLAANPRLCAGCDQELEVRPRAHHQLYCSRQCEYAVRGR